MARRRTPKPVLKPVAAPATQVSPSVAPVQNEAAAQAAEALLADARREADVALAASQEEAREIVRAANEEQEQIRGKASTRAAQIIAGAEQEAARLADEARTRANRIRAEADSEAVDRQAEAELAAQRVEKAAQARADEVRDLARKDAEQAAEDARARADRIIGDAAGEASNVLRTATAQAQERIAEAEAAAEKAQRAVVDAQTRADRITDGADLDAQRIRAAAQQHLDGIQARTDKKQRRDEQIDDWSPRVALGAVIGLTATGEYSLAQLAGWFPGIAWLLPLGIDVYVVQALRRHRDVFPALILMVAANAVYHLAAAGLFGMRADSHGTLKPEWWLIASVAAIAPWVMLRIHVITAAPRERRWRRRESKPAPTLESTSERALELSPASMSESASPSHEPLSPPDVESPSEASHESPLTEPQPQVVRRESRAKAKPKRRESRRRPATAAEVSPIGDIDHELAALVALMTERGDADAVKLSDAKRITGKSEPTAARRLSAARAQYRRTA